MRNHKIICRRASNSYCMYPPPSTEVKEDVLSVVSTCLEHLDEAFGGI